MKRHTALILAPVLVAAALVTAGCIEPDPIGDLPTVSYIAPVNCYAGQTIVFDASGSSDTEGPITSYGFQFGDDSPAARSTNPIIEHTYDAPGVYVTKVTVVDDHGNKSTDLRELSVLDPDGEGQLRCQDDRPYCPPHYTCDRLSLRCDVIEVYCESDAACPMTTTCKEGVCQLGERDEIPEP